MFGFKGVSVSEKPLEHWVVSTICFSVIVHVVTIKLFIESVFWHWISVGSAFASVLLYHLVIMAGSTTTFADVF